MRACILNVVPGADDELPLADLLADYLEPPVETNPATAGSLPASSIAAPIPVGIRSPHTL